ncbi:protocatechuate 3,4-dioxygenase [Candidatus Anaplasma sp. TIGMIC]|uniref:dioxygenase family protein n=1 Tax=Candidatus Anaplasma sp. TIGMIC TaxID=3020713 RepID=UPI00232FD2CD|nr:protocatechuate 3,4-dioxygenase [Candidatus Anaplasma sp. TIGMIC]MDB1135181.1 protocatechuate 3,4-dioxygenase [Candidatus Anaplasma sp. TIGMIC]
MVLPCEKAGDRSLSRGVKSVLFTVTAAVVMVGLGLCAIEARAVDSVLVNCVETPGIKDVTDAQKPAVFNISNNLARKAGSPDSAEGKKIFLIGRVTDAHCNPVTNANVFIWQADSRGVYSGDPGYDKMFLGSGKATTDNLGNYGFITVMPGKHRGADPKVHFLIKHHAFPDFQTEMFFEGENSIRHSSLSRIPRAMKRLLTARHVGQEYGVDIYEFNLTFADIEDTPYEPKSEK